MPRAPPKKRTKAHESGSESPEYSPSRRARLPKKGSNHSTPPPAAHRRTCRTRSQTAAQTNYLLTYVRDPYNSDDSDGLVTTAVDGINNSMKPRNDSLVMSGAIGAGDPIWISAGGWQRRKIESRISSDSNGQEKTDSDEQDQQLNAVIQSSQTSEEGDTSATEDQRLTSVAKDLQTQKGSVVTEGSAEVPNNAKRVKLSHVNPHERISRLDRIKIRGLLAIKGDKKTDFQNYSDDELEFQPADISTPFNANHARSMLPLSDSASLGSRKRKFSPPEVQVPRSSPAVEETPTSSQPHAEMTTRLDTLPHTFDHVEDNAGSERSDEVPAVMTFESGNGEYEGDKSSETSDPPLPPIASKKLNPIGTPAEQPSWMAPPASSSSPVRNPRPTDNDTISKASKAIKPLTSQTLKSMLPKRRTKAREDTPNEFDIPIEDEDDSPADDELETDEDELSYLPSHRAELENSSSLLMRAKYQPKKPSRAHQINKDPTKASIPSKMIGLRPVDEPSGKAVLRKRIATNNKITKPKDRANAGTRTPPVYASVSATATANPTNVFRPPSASSNKENRHKPTSSPLSTPPELMTASSEVESGVASKSNGKGKETKILAKKFAEVDDWSLDYEEVSLGGSSDLGKR